MDVSSVNTLASRGIGDNKPLLSEVLLEELAADRAHADELLAAAREARITSSADAARVADLLVMIGDHERAVDRTREARKRPYIQDVRTIDTAYGAIVAPLARARTGPGSLLDMLESWRQDHPGEPLATTIAAVGSRRVSTHCIEDLPAVIEWLLHNQPGPLSHAVRTIIGTIIRAAGVDAIERGEVKIPGVSITLASKVQVR